MSFLFAGRWNLLCGVVLILFSSMAWFAQTFTAGTQDGSRGSGRFGQTMECWTGYKTTIKDWPAITTTPDKLFLTGVSGSVPRFASLKTCAVEYVGFLLIQRTGKQRKARGLDSDPLIEIAAQHLRVLDKRTPASQDDHSHCGVA